MPVSSAVFNARPVVEGCWPVAWAISEAVARPSRISTCSIGQNVSGMMVGGDVGGWLSRCREAFCAGESTSRRQMLPVAKSLVHSETLMRWTPVALRICGSTSLAMVSQSAARQVSRKSAVLLASSTVSTWEMAHSSAVAWSMSSGFACTSTKAVQCCSGNPPRWPSTQAMRSSRNLFQRAESVAGCRPSAAPSSAQLARGAI